MDKNTNFYREIDSDNTMSNYPYTATFGGIRNRTTRNNKFDLQEQIAKNSRDISSYSELESETKNEILQIPSFLQYPQDLGRNKRHHHFMVFNIYQGDSDNTMMENRFVNQASSALLAKGNFNAGSGSQGSSEVDNRDLYSAGFSDQQRDLLKPLLNMQNASSGVTNNEILFSAESGINSFKDVLNSPTGGFVEASKQLLSAVGGDLSELLLSLGIGKVTTDISGELNKLNYNVTGLRGKPLNRPKWEQNILLANRRFGYANVKSKDTICLYMPLKITFNDQLIYSEEEMGMAKSVLQTLALQRGGMSAVIERAGVGAISNMVNSATSAIGIENVNIQAARNAATRSVANPRREMMFRDVGLRQHSFTFEFAPKNSHEADAVLNIIRMFRYHAYPSLRGGGGHFFKFPAEFQAEFYTITPAGAAIVNDYIPRLPRLALTSINVDYSAAGDYKTFTDGKPAFIRVDLGFQEMEQLNNEHIIHGY